MKSKESQPTFLNRCAPIQIFRVTVFLAALLPFVTLSANSFPAGAATSARLGGICASELRWTSISPTLENPSGGLICLQTLKGLRWQNPAKVKADAHLNSILLKCGQQMSAISINKVSSQILGAYKLAEAKYISTQLHLKLVSYVTNWGFFNLNVKYYGRVGMCSNGVGNLTSYRYPDTRIPANAELLWESFANCKIGIQTAPLEFAFAQVNNGWKFVAMGAINAQPAYL